MRVLLVEDDMHLADSLTEILTIHRYVVDLVKDSESAWEQIKTFQNLGL